MKRYIKPPEPKWTPEQDLLFAAEFLHATALQLGTLQHRTGLRAGVAEKINLAVKKVDYSKKELTTGFIKAGTEADAADYFDNQSALMWELCNEMRKMNDRRLALTVLRSINAGMVFDKDGVPINQIDFEKPQARKGRPARRITHPIS